MKILVTGATGFVGGHLCSFLADSGHSVRSAVRSPGTAPPLTEESVVGQIDGHTDWTEAVRGQDVVIHLAARVHVMQETEADPLRAFRTVNVDGTVALANAAALEGIDRFIYMSSVKVHGESSAARPFTANDAAHPSDPYAISKHEAEQELRQCEGPMQVTVIRIPLVYGPGVGGNFVQLLKMLTRRFPLPLGGIENRRSMISIWNLTDLLLYSINREQRKFSVILASDKTALSTTGIMRTLGAGLGGSPCLFKCPKMVMRLGGWLLRRQSMVSRLTDSLEIDSSASSGTFDWIPPITAEEGLKKTAMVWLKKGSE